MEVRHILKRFYNLENCIISKLEGYDSTNYKIVSRKEIYVLKQNSFSKETLALLIAENRVLNRTQVLKNFNFSKVIPSSSGEAYYSLR